MNFFNQSAGSSGASESHKMDDGHQQQQIDLHDEPINFENYQRVTTVKSFATD